MVQSDHKSQLQHPTHQSVTVYARRQLVPSGGVVTSAWSPRCGQAMEPSASIAEAPSIPPRWEECSAESAQWQKCNKHLATFSVKSLRACFPPRVLLPVSPRSDQLVLTPYLITQSIVFVISSSDGTKTKTPTNFFEETF